MNNLGLSDDRRQSRTPLDEGAVEVHFVWSRGKKKRKTRNTNGSQTAGANRRSSTAVSPSKTSSGGSSVDRSATIDKVEKRLSTASGYSASTGSEVGSSAGRTRGDGDDGDESEPEDSETPWTCTLVLSRLGGTGSLGGGANGSNDSESVVRVRVATFSPTPHHPKVVALLKVPFPLPDVVVDQLQVRRRSVSPQGIARPSWNLNAGADAPDGVVLTAEEIKDVVSSTGLWLVVRESIGGVGKISRKGDGWRIRA
jgi:hypothetical protein